MEPAQVAEPSAPAPPLEPEPAAPAPEERTGDLDAADLKRAKEAGPIVETRGGERFAPRLIKWLFLLLFPVGIAAAYIQGYLDPVIHSPTLKATFQTVSDFTQPYLMQLVEKYPEIGQWISPISSLEDVSPEEYEELRVAASTPEGQPVKHALALSKGDLLNPVFYVAAHVSDNTQVVVQVEGLPDTLLNTTSFVTKTPALFSKRLAKSLPVKFNETKPVPRGQYKVTVFAVGAPKGSPAPTGTSDGEVKPQMLAAKTYFLGGAKDATYVSRLKEFHDKLKQKAATEIGELSQFAQTVETQLNDTLARFAALHKADKKGKVPAGAKKTWGDFHAKWSGLEGQLTQTFQKWTPDSFKNDFFYGVLYEKTQQAAQAVERLHEFHNQFFTGNVDAKGFEIQVGEATSVAQGAVSALRAKIDQAKNIPPSPNGMPRKDGL
jgi:hypothetical protein